MGTKLSFHTGKVSSEARQDSPASLFIPETAAWDHLTHTHTSVTSLNEGEKTRIQRVHAWEEPYPPAAAMLISLSAESRDWVSWHAQAVYVRVRVSVLEKSTPFPPPFSFLLRLFLILYVLNSPLLFCTWTLFSTFSTSTRQRSDELKIVARTRASTSSICAMSAQRLIQRASLFPS